MYENEKLMIGKKNRMCDAVTCYGRSIKTRQSEFLKLFPNAMTDTNTGVLTICPKGIFGEQCKYPDTDCDTCCEKFWLESVEEEDS